jgi:hypothetical protein
MNKKSRAGRPKGAKNRKYRESDYLLCIKMAKLQIRDAQLSDWAVARRVAPEAVGFDGDTSFQGKCVRRLHDSYKPSKDSYMRLAEAELNPPPPRPPQSLVGMLTQIQRQQDQLLAMARNVDAMTRPFREQAELSNRLLRLTRPFTTF